MEKKMDFKRSLIIILAVIVVALGGLVVYEKVLKKDTNAPVDGKESSEQNGKLYHIEDGEKFTVYKITPLEDDDWVNSRIEISFAYPVIDIDSDEIKGINKKISDQYKSYYQTNLSQRTNKNGGCVAVKKDGLYYGGEHVFYNTYKISENEKYLSVVITNVAYTECAGGGNSYSGWVIDKSTKKVMSNKEILKLFNAENSEKLFIDKYNSDADTIGHDKAKTIDDVPMFIYDKKLVVVSVGGEFDSLLQYNNGKLEDFND